MTILVTTLDNGMRVVTDDMATVETASVGVWVDAGARFETVENNGVSHMLEHMAFKGTRRRSAQAIAEEIEAVGGHLNAYTSRENTAYYAKVLKEDVDLAVDMIGDILLNSVMDPTELERERTVILQEISQANDTPDDIVFDRFQETALPGQGMGLPVLGTAERVGAMGREQIMGYMTRHYRAPSMVFSAAGRIEHERLLDLVGATFAGLGHAEPGSPDPMRYQGGDYREVRDIEQAHLMLGFESVSYDDPDHYPAAVLSALFGGGMSSRLFQEVRERRGLAYSVYCYNSSYVDGGLFAVYAGTAPGDLRELVPVLCDEILKIQGDITEAEINRARAQIKASILMSLESTSARCEQQARQLMVFDRTIPTDEVIAHIDGVTTADLARVAKRIVGSPLTVTALGPVKKLEPFEKIADRLR